MPSVSVIIPTFNRAGYLPGCIESVLAQTYRDYEVIVVDDGSTDNTREAIDPFLREKALSYIRQENKGPGIARNFAISQAAGEWIAMLDTDDLWPPDKLEWQAQYLAQHPEAGVIGGGFQWMDESGAKTGPPVLRDGVQSFEDIFGGPPFAAPGQTLIRKRVFEEAGGFEEAWLAEDFDLWLKLARIAPIVCVPRIALYYRLHGSNCSRSALPMYLACRRVLRRNLALAPAQARPALRRRAMRWLFDYRGAAAIREWKERLRRGDLRDGWRYAAAFAWFLGGALREPSFLAAVLKEILPARFFPDPARGVSKG